MSQQKTIQAIGRVGRNNVQQEYTVRFRDDSIILNLFKQQDHNIEAETMCRLLVSDVDEEEDLVDEEDEVVGLEEDLVDEEDEVVCSGLRNEDDDVDTDF
jgi:2-phospho-L-lactate guanylyltransferase (CobY/MobA/RfbA family)